MRRHSLRWVLRIRRVLSVPASLCVLLCTVNGCTTAVASIRDNQLCANPVMTTRHELYLGMRRPDSSVVTELQFADFVSEEVSQHFPEGFTVVDANGQYQLANGTRIEEPAKILVLVYPDDLEVREKIRDLVLEYQTRFGQESVGWVRTPARACF